jgi:predicted phage tail protein
MINIYLTGKLGRLFGKKWTLNVKSPAEAIRAIDINVKGQLRKYLSTEGAKKYYKVALQKKDNIIYKEEISNPSGQSDIYIIPTIKGSGKVGTAIGMIVIGVALVYLAILSGGTALYACGFLGEWTTTVAMMGASLILGGISQLLAPTPDISESSASDQKTSSMFQGNASTIMQGGAVPIAYGRILISPMPIGVSTAAYDQAATKATVGSVTVTELDGGGYQYDS